MTQLTQWLAQHAGHRRLLVPDFTSVRWVSSQLAQQGVATLGLRVEVESDVRLNAADPFPAYWPESRRLRAVSDAQLETQSLQRELQLDNPTVSLEETMVAMQKAQLGFQATVQVRNRLVQAYSEIMNMQV